MPKPRKPRALKKCKGLFPEPCGRCARQDDNHTERLVMGMAHGRCVHFKPKFNTDAW